MKCLFISGFNTHPDERDGYNTYKLFELLYRKSPDNLEIFRYKTYENGEDVLRRLKKQICKCRYDIIISHSLGSAFLYKLLVDEQARTVLHKAHRLVLLMPQLCVDPCANLVFNFTALSDIPIPISLFMPSSKLASGGNYPKGDGQLVVCRQFKYAYNNLMPMSSSDAVSTINSFPNLRIMVAENDTIAKPMPAEYMKRINKGRLFVLYDGLHEGFRSPDTQEQFFDVFDEMLL
jgi:hypothetical protein